MWPSVRNGEQPETGDRQPVCIRRLDWKTPGDMLNEDLQFRGRVTGLERRPSG
jgi:hypothetical protein